MSVENDKEQIRLAGVELARGAVLLRDALKVLISARVRIASETQWATPDQAAVMRYYGAALNAEMLAAQASGELRKALLQEMAIFGVADHERIVSLQKAVA